MSAVFAQRVAWRRRHVRHHYVGTLTESADAIRLEGREPCTRIDVELSIPFEEIERVRVAESADESVVGERAVVLELVGSDDILLREIGLEPHDPAELGGRLARRRAEGGEP